MEENKFYQLPDLPYGYKSLEPFLSEEQVAVHHQKHHLAYVKGANAILEKLDKAREDTLDLDLKAALKELSFNVGGFCLHKLFWENLAPAGKVVKEPMGIFADEIKDEFGSFDRFKKEFTAAALSVEGSGWAALVYSSLLQRPMIAQIEKHNTNVYPGLPIVLVLDVFEHAYYIDYKNDRAKYIEAFWNIVNFKEIKKRFENLFMEGEKNNARSQGSFC